MSTNPLRPDEKISLELRAEALDMLRAKGRFALERVENLLGWESSVGMTIRVMARQLGITEGQLKYLLWRNDLREKEKAQRIAEGEARKVPLFSHTSHRLGFSITLPGNWQVITDTLEWSRVSQEFLQLVLHSRPAERPTQTVFRNGEAVNDPHDLKELAEREFVGRLADAERHAWLEQMATGLFQAEPADHKEAAFVEVIKLRMNTPLTALDLYKLDKSSPEMVPWGNRPSKGVIVDGLPGVVYYYLMYTDEPPKNRQCSTMSILPTAIADGFYLANASMANFISRRSESTNRFLGASLIAFEG